MAAVHRDAAAPSSADRGDGAGERWRNALAELEYAERHSAPSAEVEQLANQVIEARVAMFRSGVQGGWALPAFLRSALDRDRELLDVNGTVPAQAPASRLQPPAGTAEGRE
jgi:hypothetical protein